MINSTITNTEDESTDKSDETTVFKQSYSYKDVARNYLLENKETLLEIVKILSFGYYHLLIVFWSYCIDTLGLGLNCSENFMKSFSSHLMFGDEGPLRKFKNKIHYDLLSYYGALIFGYWKNVFDEYYISINEISVDLINTFSSFVLPLIERMTLIPQIKDINQIVNEVGPGRRSLVHAHKHSNHLPSTMLLIFVILILFPSVESLNYCSSYSGNFTDCEIQVGYIIQNCGLNGTMLENFHLFCNEKMNGSVEAWYIKGKVSNEPNLFCQIQCLNFSTVLPLNGCDGDSHYRSSFSYVENSPCFVQLLNKSQDCYLKRGNIEIPILERDCAYIKYQLTNFSGLVENFVPGLKIILESHSKRSLTFSNNMVFSTLVDQNLLVQQTMTEKLFVFLSKDTWNVAYICEATSCVFSLPASVWILNGFLNVYVSNNSTVLLQTNLEIVSRTTCVIHDCLFCEQTFSFASCAPKSYKIAAIIVIVFLSVLVLALLPCLFFAIRILFITLLIPFKLCYYAGTKASKSKSMNYLRSMYIQQDKSEEEMKEISKDIETGNSPSSVAMQYRKFARGKGNNIQNQLTLIIVLISLVTFTNSCSSNLFIPFESNVCTKISNSAQSCVGTFSAVFTLSSIGDSVCFSVNNSFGVVTNGIVTYKQMLNTVSLDTQYYTAGWSGQSQSNSYCPSERTCRVDTSGGCPSISQSDRTMSNVLDNQLVISYPGRVGCDNGCGCAGCGCFYCTPSCVYWGWSMVPSSTVYTVASPFSSNLSPTVSFILNDVETLLTSVGLTGQNGNFTITNLGSLSGDVTIFGENNVVFSGQNAWFGKASKKNAPIQQNVGDIQSSNSESLNLASPSAFIFDPNICTKTVSGRSTNFLFAQQGINTLVTFDNLPKMIAGNLWSYSEGNLLSPIQNPGSLLVKVSTTEPVTIIQNVNLVCPNCGESISASGCYDCSLGFTANVVVKSTCLPGIVSIASSDSSVVINTRTAIIDLVEKHIIVSGSTPNEHNSFNIIVTGNGGQCSIPVLFTAVQNISLRNDSTSSQEGSNLSQTLSDLLTFDDDVPIWQSLLTYLAIAIILFLIVILTPIAFKVIRSCYRSSRNVIKINSTMNKDKSS